MGTGRTEGANLDRAGFTTSISLQNGFGSSEFRRFVGRGVQARQPESAIEGNWESFTIEVSHAPTGQQVA